MPFLNSKRLHDYPRLMLIATWSILAINLLFHQGWIGAFGQVIGGDFITFYSTGMIYHSNHELIYDYEPQQTTQQSLVSPANLPGHNPNINPPYVAPLYSILTIFPLRWSFILWTILSILSILLTVYLLQKVVPVDLIKNELSFSQLVIVTISFFPFIEGLLSGQNHWLTLLLVSGIVFSMMKEKVYLSGLLAGLLIYKPQYVIGFVLIWLIWKSYKSLISFSIVVIIWIGLYVFYDGTTLILKYLQLNSTFMNLPYLPGFPKYLLLTVYGFLTSFFLQKTQPILAILSQAILVLSALALVWLAIKLRGKSMFEKTPAIIGAILLPLLASPYALLHDAMILIPAFVLWAVYSRSQKFLAISMVVYLSFFILTFIGALTKIALVSIITISLAVIFIQWIYFHRQTIFEINQ